MSQSLKTRLCLDCSTTLLGITSKYSGKRYCTECAAERRRVSARKHYANGQPESRIRAKEKQREYVRNNIPYKLLLSARSRSKQAKLEFNLTVDDIIVPEVCPVFKTPFKKGTEYTASIDRIDSTKGYIKGNVQVLSWKANTMKSNATPEELVMFSDWITRVAKLPAVPEFKEK